MTGWLSATLDVSYQTATRLLGVARADHGEIRPGLRSGRFGLDRAFLLSRLSAMRPEDDLWRKAAEGYSLGRPWGLLDRLRRADSARERFSASDRFLVMQPSLDEARPGVIGDSAPPGTATSSKKPSHAGPRASPTFPTRPGAGGWPTP
jgi:hypothetical protein